MPLTNKGEEIKAAMQKQYGPDKGEKVFYASRNKGTISGVDAVQDAPLSDERLPRIVTAKEINERNRAFWCDPGEDPIDE